MNDYQNIFNNNIDFFNNMNNKYNIYDSIENMVNDFSGIFIVFNKDNSNDYSFKLVASYITTKGNSTKKKQLYSLGKKTIRIIDNEKVQSIRNEFERLVNVFTQLKNYQKIDEVEILKETQQ